MVNLPEIVSESLPYIYLGVAAANSTYFYIKGRKDTKFKETKWGLGAFLLTGIDLLPLVFGDPQTLHEKAGLDSGYILNMIEIGTATFGQIAMGYHNLGIGKHDEKRAIEEHYNKIKNNLKSYSNSIPNFTPMNYHDNKKFDWEKIQKNKNLTFEGQYNENIRKSKIESMKIHSNNIEPLIINPQLAYPKNNFPYNGNDLLSKVSFSDLAKKDMIKYNNSK